MAATDTPTAPSARRRWGRRSSDHGVADAAAPPTVPATDPLLDALDRSHARIEFTPDGTILDANHNFLTTFGYRKDEVVGHHHSMFVDPRHASSSEYTDFWKQLAAGEHQTAEYLRFGKGGRQVWIQATYHPVLTPDGTVDRVVKLAVDITTQREAQRSIRDASQAVIEFTADGTIVEANGLFLDTVGYRLDDVVGRHHRMFMPPGEADTPEYSEHWAKLARGEAVQGQFHRVDSLGNDIWLQGAYNPIFDRNGRVRRVVKGVADVTGQVRARASADEVGGRIAHSISEMDGAIAEISNRLAGTARLASSAAADAESAKDVVERLDQSSESIGKVVTVIQRLSEQTNLLALNATIEAARAGESGRGFAVVANEVKLLSNQTGDATDEIRNSIHAIQESISTVVSAIEGIADGVAEVSSNTNTVAAGVEEQALLMAEMSDTATELLAVNRTV